MWRRGWLPWWIAACLIALAFIANQQMQIQRQVLMRSRELERVVATSGQLSHQTQAQLAAVGELAAVTERMSGKLVRTGEINGQIRTEVERLEQTVEEIRRAIGSMNEQTRKSHAHLQQIATELATLQVALQETKQVGGQVTARLERLVTLQEAVSADLAEMARKTAILDRFAGGE